MQREYGRICIGYRNQLPLYGLRILIVVQTEQVAYMDAAPLHCSSCESGVFLFSLPDSQIIFIVRPYSMPSYVCV